MFQPQFQRINENKNNNRIDMQTVSSPVGNISIFYIALRRVTLHFSCFIIVMLNKRQKRITSIWDFHQRCYLCGILMLFLLYHQSLTLNLSTFLTLAKTRQAVILASTFVEQNVQRLKNHIHKNENSAAYIKALTILTLMITGIRKTSAITMSNIINSCFDLSANM